MTPAVRYSALVALLVVTGLWAWYAGEATSDTPSHAGDDYTVTSRETVPDLGVVGEVLIPSLDRSAPNREALLRSIADAEGLTVAFYFSTQEAIDAHQLADRDQAATGALRAGFLGRLTRDEFTPGEEIYP
jgi:hypothetical protein